MSNRQPTVHKGVAPISYAAILEALDEIPTAIRVLRRIRRLSLEQVAREMDVALSSVQRLEGGGGCNMTTMRLALKWLDSQPETELDKELRESVLSVASH